MPSLLQPRTPGMNYGNRGSVANGYPKSFGSGLRARQPSPPLTEGPDDAPPSPSPTPFAVSKRLPLLNGNGSVPQPGLGGIEGPMDRDPTGRRIQVGPQTGRMGLQSRASNQISNNIDQMVKTHNQKLKSMWDQHDKYVNTMEGVGSQTDYQKDLGWQASQIANGDQVARGRGAQDLTGFGRGLVAAQAQGLPQQEPINARGNGDFVPQGGPVDPQRLAEAKALFAGKTSGQNFADAKRKQRESLDVPGTTNGFFNFGVGAREAREKYRDQNLIARSQLPGMNPNHPKVVEAKIREQRRLNAMQLPDREEELHSNRLQQLHDAHADVILKGAAKLAESGKEADITKAADMIQKHIANVELIRNPKKMATIDPNEFLPAKTGGQPIPRSQLKAATQPPRPGVTEPDRRGQGSSTESGAVGDTPMKRASLLLGPLLDLIAPKIERSDPAAFLKKK